MPGAPVPQQPLFLRQQTVIGDRACDSDPLDEEMRKDRIEMTLMLISSHH